MGVRPPPPPLPHIPLKVLCGAGGGGVDAGQLAPAFQGGGGGGGGRGVKPHHFFRLSFQTVALLLSDKNRPRPNLGTTKNRPRPPSRPNGSQANGVRRSPDWHTV